MTIAEAGKKSVKRLRVPEPRAGELAQLPADCQRACIGRDHSHKDGHACRDGACDPSCKPCDKRAQWYQFGSENKLFCDDHKQPDYAKLLDL
jgi:hypothetical protein